MRIWYDSKRSSDWNRLSRVIAAVALVVSFVTAMFVTAFVTYERLQQDSRRQAELNSASEIIAAHVYNYDILAVRGVGQTLSNYEFIQKVQIYGAHENELFNSSGDLPNTRRKIITVPMYSDAMPGEQIGTLKVWIDNPSWWWFAALAVGITCILFFLIFLPSRGVLRYYVRLFVERPLAKLSDAIDQTLASGEPATTEFRDATQLGRFATQFNNMQTRLVDVQKDLRIQSEISREQAEVLEEILVGGNEVVRHFNKDGQFRDYNRAPAGQRLFEHIPVDPILKAEDAAEILSEASDIRSVRVIRKIDANCITDGAAKLYEIEIKGPGELLRSVEAVKLSRDDLAIIVRDVTEIRRLEQTTQHAMRMESLGALTGGVAHDINNILAVINGNLQMMEMTYEDDPYIQQRVKSALQAGQNGGEVVKALLSFSRQKTEDGVLVNLMQAVSEVRPILESSLPANIKLNIEANERVFVKTSQAELGTAILNLVVNGRDAMPNGGRITLRSGYLKPTETAVELPGDEDTVAIFITDEGEGIPEAILNRISDPFYTTKPAGKGTGMGLALVHAFARRSNGRLSYWNNSEKGATFCLAFPEAPAAELIKLTGAQTPVEAEPAKQSARVLLVDDEPDLAAVLRECLKRDQHEVTVAHSVFEATTAVKRPDQFDLIITDFTMPDGTGLDVLDHVREIDRDVPIALMTGYLSWRSDEAGREKEFSDILSKPLDLNVFRNKVASAVARSHSNVTQLRVPGA